MYTIIPNQIRLSSLIMLIGLFSLALAGQRWLWPALQTLQSANRTATTTSQPLVIDAGPPALLLLNADALVLATENGATQVTARVRDAEGKPVAGAAVNFSSAQGSVAPTDAVTDAAGVAVTSFTAGGAQGQAVVTAAVNGLTRDAAIQIVKPNSDATAHTLALDFGATNLDPGQEAAITAVLRDAAGQPVAGELVSLFGSLGEVTPASAMSDDNGRITASYRAGNAPGQAMITVLAGYASQSVEFQVGEQTAPQQPEHLIFLPAVSK